MAAADDTFILRPMQPSDSASVTSLITEFGGGITTRFLVDAYLAITAGTENETLGVVVERAGQDGLAGMGTLRFSQVQYNGSILPLAFLDGLKVDENFRGRGLGYQIASWRIQKARERFGEQGVIATGMLHDNHASRAVAAKWSREFLDPAFDVLILPIRSRPPAPRAGIEICEIEPHQFEEFSVRRNAFFQDYNFYPPGDASAIASALGVSVAGRAPYRFYAAVDARGNMLAGAQAWARGLLKSDTINAIPTPLRVMNRVLHLLPPDYVIRDAAVSGLWYEPGQMRAARYLWEMMRWLLKDQATNLVACFDSRDPAREVIALKPWHQPRPIITMAVHGPGEVDRNRLVFAAGRV
jgi:predicted N-acetyltransferase YhbS